MKKLLLTSEGKFHLNYQSWLNKYRVKQEFVSFVEIIILSTIILLCIWTHLIYVNQTSTKWYDVRQSRNILKSVSFDYEIEKTKILDLKKINWDKLQENDSSTLLWTNIETIIID